MSTPGLTWRVLPRPHVLAVLWVLPVLLAALLITGFSWIVLFCGLFLAGIALVFTLSPLRIILTGRKLSLRYWFYIVDIPLADIAEVTDIDGALVGVGYKRTQRTTSFLLGGPYVSVRTNSGSIVVFSVRSTFRADLDAVLDKRTGRRRS